MSMTCNQTERSVASGWRWHTAPGILHLVRCRFGVTGNNADTPVCKAQRGQYAHARVNLTVPYRGQRPAPNDVDAKALPAAMC